MWRRLSPDRVLALAPGRTDATRLDGPAAVIWELVAEPVSDYETIELLAEVFGRDPTAIGRQVAQVLEELVDQGLADRLGPE